MSFVVHLIVFLLIFDKININSKMWYKHDINKEIGGKIMPATDLVN